MLSNTKLLSVGVILSVLPWGTCLADDPSPSPQEQIRKLVPTATAMRREDFEKIARAPRPTKDSVKEQSLTWVLFSLDLKGKKSLQFRYLTEPAPHPSELANEVYRQIGSGRFAVLTAPVTMIQANRITKLTCQVQDDSAQGKISFRVPKLYAGEVDYVAEKRESGWVITDFTMSDFDVHIRRHEDGRWKRVPIKD